jgi:hypothetical protein
VIEFLLLSFTIKIFFKTLDLRLKVSIVLLSSDELLLEMLLRVHETLHLLFICLFIASSLRDLID